MNPGDPRSANPWQQFAHNEQSPGLPTQAGFPPLVPPAPTRPPVSGGRIIATVAAIAFILSGLVVGGFLIAGSTSSRGAGTSLCAPSVATPQC